MLGQREVQGEYRRTWPTLASKGWLQRGRLELSQRINSIYKIDKQGPTV